MTASSDPPGIPESKTCRVGRTPRLTRGAPGFLLALAFILTAGPAAAQSSDLAGFWKGLSERGLSPRLTYLGEIFSTVSGGLRTGSADLHNLSLTFLFDLRRLAGWQGATILIYGMGIAGGNPERHFGDIQGVSNIAAPSAVRLYEAWLGQDLAAGRLSLLAGLYDLNSEFDVIEAATVFLNPSQGIDPTLAFSGLHGPSVFPYTTLGFRARFKAAGFYLQSALMNGLAGDPADPDGTRIVFRKGNGALLVAEAGYHLPLTLRRHRRQPVRESVRRYVAPSYAGKIAVGLWSYTARFAPVLPRPGEPDQIRGDAGFYILLSHAVWREAGDPGRDLTFFARAGRADPRLNRLGFFAGGGLAFTGLFPGRGRDIAGLALAAAFNGDDYMKKAALAGSSLRRAEWNLELTYQARLLKWLDLHPDVQLIIHPGMASAVRSALGFDIRVEISL